MKLLIISLVFALALTARIVPRRLQADKKQQECFTLVLNPNSSQDCDFINECLLQGYELSRELVFNCLDSNQYTQPRINTHPIHGTFAAPAPRPFIEPVDRETWRAPIVEPWRAPIVEEVIAEPYVRAPVIERAPIFEPARAPVLEWAAPVTAPVVARPVAPVWAPGVEVVNVNGNKADKDTKSKNLKLKSDSRR